MGLEGGTRGEDSVGLLCNCLDGSAQCYWEDLAKHLPGQDRRGQCWFAVQLSGGNFPSAGKTWQSTFQVKVGLFSYCQI